MRHFDDAGNSARARVCKPPEPGLITRVMKSVSASPQTERPASVMIEKFATLTGKVPSEFLDLNHTSKSMILVSLMIPKFAPGPSSELWPTSESGH